MSDYQNIESGTPEVHFLKCGVSDCTFEIRFFDYGLDSARIEMELHYKAGLHTDIEGNFISPPPTDKITINDSVIYNSNIGGD